MLFTICLYCDSGSELSQGETTLLPLEFSDKTVVRLPRGASSSAKQSGWMLMPMRETMQGCCSEWSMLASWRNSEKFFMASMALRCFSMVSGKTNKPLLTLQLRKHVRDFLQGATHRAKEISCCPFSSNILSV